MEDEEQKEEELKQEKVKEVKQEAKERKQEEVDEERKSPPAETEEVAEEKDEKSELEEAAPEAEVMEAAEDEDEVEEEEELKDQVISIRRVTKVVKGGKNLSFSAIAAVGNGVGMVGIGKGKAREVPMAIAKAVEDAKKKMIEVPLADTTIPHFIKGIADGGEVILRPASKGTGVIAGGAVRVIMELAGIKDILTKSLRSNNPVSVANATIDALRRLKDPESVSKYRGKSKDRIWQ